MTIHFHNGSDGKVKLTLNHHNPHRPADAIFLKTTRMDEYNLEYVTISPEQARTIAKELVDLADAFDALTPKEPKRLDIIRAYTPGTVFTTRSWASTPDKFIRLDGENVFNVGAAKTTTIDNQFDNAFGTKDLKVIG